MTNIRRGEPDPSLFQLPSGYQVTNNAARSMPGNAVIVKEQ
jgi:hypothetical protein